jgi:tetratricopeptide (TPR) repeat protein
LVFIFLVFSSAVEAQTPGELSEKEIETANALFAKANGQLEKKEYASAQSNYEALLKLLPDNPSILYNGGFAAFLNNDIDTAVRFWARLKDLEPNDWQVRAKLIQAYQRLERTADRDRERNELFDLRKGGKNKELNEQVEYCRDRFTSGGRSVLAFELFEFKGPRGIRYVFSVMNDNDAEDYRISLGSYDITDAIWREMTKPTPKDGVRLFHLDGYFKNGAHATYGMFPGEPTYEATKKLVVGILEKANKPISATIPAGPQKP